MARINFTSVKALINDYIKANGNKEITGTILNGVLIPLLELAYKSMIYAEDQNYFTGEETYFDGSLYIANQDTTGVFTPAHWDPAQTIGDFLPLTGGTLTGPLILSADALDPMEAVTLQQLLSAISGVFDLQQGYDASSNLFPTAANTSPAVATVLKGMVWNISVAGTLGGQPVTPGDTVTALSDSPGQTSSNWLIIEHNFGFTPISNVVPSANIIVGNASNVGEPVPLTGDASISNAGVFTLNANLKRGSIGITIDGGGSVITAGTKGCIRIPNNCAATDWNLIEDSDTPISSSIVLDVWVDSYANYPPTVADTIFGTKPQLSAATKNQASGLNIPLTGGHIMCFHVDSNTGAKRIQFEFGVAKT